MYIYVYIHTYTHTYIYRYTHTYINTNIHNIHTHTHIHKYIHTCVRTRCIHACRPWHTHIHTCIRTHTYIHTYIHTCIHTYIQLHTFVQTHIYTYLYIHCMHNICMCLHMRECAHPQTMKRQNVPGGGFTPRAARSRGRSGAMLGKAGREVSDASRISGFGGLRVCRSTDDRSGLQIMSCF